MVQANYDLDHNFLNFLFRKQHNIYKTIQTALLIEKRLLYRYWIQYKLVEIK